MSKSSKIIKENKNQYQNQDGLTMLELLVSISIIVLVSTVILVLGDKALRQTDFFSKNAQAIFLAKEGMEIVTDKAIRTDATNAIRKQIEEIELDAETEWTGTGYWNVDYKGNVDKRTDILNCHRKLRINNDGFYAIGAPTNPGTDFSRCVIVTAENSTSELKIKIEVLFDSREGEDHGVNLYRIFYD